MSVRDFRSDTVTKPSAAMRAAMASCEVGDDVFGEDPTVLQLEHRVASMFDQEAALFFPTGTMANLAAVMSWCTQRGSEIILGDSCHIAVWEQGGSAFLGGVASRTVKTQEDGTLALADILEAIRADNVHFPVTQLVCLEQTHNMSGGQVLPDGYIAEVAREVHAKGVRVHVDGARIWNAAAAQGLSVARVAAGADSVQVCLSKGLGAPAGSVLVGGAELVSRARRARKALGGGTRQVGVLAAAGMVALDDFEAGLLLQDHARARSLAEKVAGLPGFRVEVNTVHTNMCVVHLDAAWTARHPSFTAEWVVQRLEQEYGVRVLARDASSLRVVMHRDISDTCVEAMVAALKGISDSLPLL